ncbi:MAG: hypothetical protein NVSMB55_03850 [Mycobacteriales bacterium]
MSSAGDPDVPPVRVPLVVLLPVVAAGGAVGSLGRYGIALLVPHGGAELPVGTLLVNVTGCFLLGVLVARWPQAPWLRPVLGTGMLGGFTTFSALALETDRLLARAPVVAVLYLGLSLLLGIGAAALGLRVRR